MWQDITQAPRAVAERTAVGLEFGDWLVLSDGQQQRRGRWRYPVSRYDIQTDETISRPGDWRGEDDKPLGFEPTRFAYR